MLTGNTPDAIKAEVKMDFDRSRCYENGRSPKWDVVFANYKAGGQGLNFTDVTQLIALDEEWSDANAQQAFARMNRIGQIETNAVHIVRMNGTIDTWLAALIEEKKNLTSNFNQAVDKQALRDAIEKGDV
jgi:SNF2 family DNA or RNA helicase